MNKNERIHKRKKKVNENLLYFLTPLFMIASCIIAASMIATIFDLQKPLNFPVITAILSLSTFLSSFIVAKRKRENGLIIGIIYNLPSIILLEILSLLLNSSAPDLNLLLSSGTLLIASALGGIIGVNSKQKVKRSLR